MQNKYAFIRRPEVATEKKLYVGNIPYSMGDDELKELFESVGKVKSAQVIQDRNTGRSKGFGFVEMDSSSAAQTAIEEMNGKDINGRSLTVNEARPKVDRPDRGGRM